MSCPSILVTGGAGYIGSHCCSRLHSAGYNPISYDNLSTGHQRFVNWGPLVIGDVGDTDRLVETMREYHVEAVMHFAASSSVGESVADPRKYYSNNVAGTLALLHAMASVNCNKLVYSSTGAVYGAPGGGLIAENAPRVPVNPYGRTKMAVEEMVSDIMRASDLRATSLRYFNACGADRSGLIGELRSPETHLIPCALMALLGHLPEFAVFGDDYDTHDGTAVRDYIHVVDLADAHLLALQSLLGGRRDGTFNLGTGAGHSVREILTVIKDVTHEDLTVVTKPRRPGDPATLVADPGAARRALGFVAKHSQLPTIIQSAWAWHQIAHARVSPTASQSADNREVAEVI